MKGYDYSRIISDWEEKVKQYENSHQKAINAYKVNRTDKHFVSLKHKRALYKSLDKVVKVLRKSLYEALSKDADPVMVFRDNLIPEKPTLDRILSHGSKDTPKNHIGDCRRIFEELEKAYTKEYISKS